MQKRKTKSKTAARSATKRRRIKTSSTSSRKQRQQKQRKQLRKKMRKRQKHILPHMAYIDRQLNSNTHTYTYEEALRKRVSSISCWELIERIAVTVEEQQLQAYLLIRNCYTQAYIHTHTHTDTVIITRHLTCKLQFIMIYN